MKLYSSKKAIVNIEELHIILIILQYGNLNLDLLISFTIHIWNLFDEYLSHKTRILFNDIKLI